jgi:hypothetical protein
VHVQDQEAILHGSDSAREVRLGIKKVHVQDQEAILPVRCVLGSRTVLLQRQ